MRCNRGIQHMRRRDMQKLRRAAVARCDVGVEIYVCVVVAGY